MFSMVSVVHIQTEEVLIRPSVVCYQGSVSRQELRGPRRVPQRFVGLTGMEQTIECIALSGVGAGSGFGDKTLIMGVTFLSVVQQRGHRA